MATFLPVLSVTTIPVAGGVVFLDEMGHPIAHAGHILMVLHRAAAGWMAWQNEDGEYVATNGMRPEQLPIDPWGWHRLC